MLNGQRFRISSLTHCGNPGAKANQACIARINAGAMDTLKKYCG